MPKLREELENLIDRYYPQRLERMQVLEELRKRYPYRSMGMDYLLNKRRSPAERELALAEYLTDYLSMWDEMVRMTDAQIAAFGGDKP